MGGGGGQTTSTVTNTNIPEYARGYVENMLDTTQQQLFTGTGEGDQFNITGFRPYQSYGGTYDAYGRTLSYDPSLAVAGFSPMQQTAQQGIYNLQTPGEFNSASQYTADAMQRAANAGYSPGQFAMGQATAPGVTYYQMNQPQNVQGQTAASTNLGNVPLGEFQTGTAQTGTAAQLNLAPTMYATQAGITQLGQTPTYTGQQLNYTPQNLNYQIANAERVNALPLKDLQMKAAGNVGTGSFTQPGAADAYMSPYMQNVVDIQQREAQRQADIAGTKRGSQFAQAGAFGGSRQAIENAEAARNLATQKGDIQAQGLQSSYQQAQQQFNAEQQAQLQAALANQQVQQQTGVQNLSALLQTQGLGAQTGLTAQQLNQQSSLQAALANQQAGMQTGQFNQQQQYNTALQNAQMLQQQQLANQGLQGQYGLQQGQMNQAINLQNAAQQQAANAANQAMFGQYGLQQGTMNQQMAMGNVANQQQMAMSNVANRQQAAMANQALQGQYGLTQGQLNQANQQFNAQQLQAANLANQQMAFNTANQNLQANLGVQQLGTGQNMQAQLANQQAMLANQQALEQSRQFGANYGQQMNAQQLAAAQQLAGIGGQQLTAQQGIYGLQNQIGGQQQQQQQQIINQAVQDYSNAQQYPLMQLGTMSNILRGLPMQASTTNMYQAAPNALTQGIGAVGAYGAFNNMFGGSSTTGKKEGGVIHAAKGGIMSYDVGGEIESTLENMDVDNLKKYAKESSSPSVKKMAMRLIQEKSMPVPRMARGGILAFAKSTEENNQSLVEGEDAEKLRKYGGAPSYMYNPGEFVSKINPFRMLGDRHAESFGTKLSAPPSTTAPVEPAPPPAALTNPSAITAVPTAGPAPVTRPAPAAPPVVAQTPPVAAPTAAPVARPPAPAGIKGAPAYPGLEPIPDTPEHIAYRRQAEAANANANKTVAQYLADVKAEQVAAGLEPENTGMKDYRARIMAERANLDDEAKRQKNLRIAEFFASWGSTPGATLVAGMTALKKTIPNLIEDEKERKKALREADKIIYDLDQAVRLEKKGDINAAADRKQNAAKIAEPYNATLARLAQDKNRDALTAQGNEATFLSDTYRANLTAETSRASTAAQIAANKEAAEARKEGRLQTLYNGALAEYNQVRTDLERDRAKDDVYQRSLMNIQAIGTIKKPSEQEQKIVSDAKNYIEKWETKNAGRANESAIRIQALAKELGQPALAATAAPAAAPVAPPGHTFVGYSTERNPLYKNAQGQVFEDRR
jgi:hypothetical protein